MSPAAAAGRLVRGLLLGALVGLLHGCLRPARRRGSADVLLALGTGWAWVVLAFGVCAGDPGMGDLLALLAGALAWENGPGRLLRPIFAGLWRLAGVPGKIFSRFLKILFASVEKWVTIKWSHYSHSRKRSKNPMQSRLKKLKNIKVECRPSPAVLKILLIALILLSTAALVTLRLVRTGIRAQTEALRDEAAAIEYANADLEERTQALGSVQSIQDIAQEELDLVDPNAVIIDVK